MPDVVARVGWDPAEPNNSCVGKNEAVPWNSRSETLRVMERLAYTIDPYMRSNALLVGAKIVNPSDESWNWKILSTLDDTSNETKVDKFPAPD